VLEALGCASPGSPLRAAALRLLRRLLWSLDASGSQLSPRLSERRPRFLRAALRCLTSAEAAQVLLEGVPDAAKRRQTRESAVVCATTGLAAGFATRSLRLVRLALDQLNSIPPMPNALGAARLAAARRAEAQRAQLAAAAAAAEEAGEAAPTAVALASPSDDAQSEEEEEEEEDDSDPSVPLCVARLLLGDADGALLAIEGHEEASAFVQARAAAEAEEAGLSAYAVNPLSGLVALAQAWLCTACLPRFKDTQSLAVVPAGAAGPVNLWFESPKVARLLDTRASTLPLRAIAAALEEKGAENARAASEALGAAPDYKPSFFGLRAGGGGRGGWAGGPFFGEGDAGALMSPATPAGPGAGAFLLAAALFVGGVAAASGAVSGRPSGIPAPVAAGASRLVVAARTGAGLMADAAGGVLRRGQNAAMNEQLAAEVVRRWQAVKASALGGRHDVASLDTVLEGGMLRQWRSRAEDVRHNGFFWEYVLVGLRVDSLRVAPGGDSARVDVTLTEAAILHDAAAAAAKGGEQEAYESTYKARYELARKPGGGGGARGWRIVAGSVLY